MAKEIDKTQKRQTNAEKSVDEAMPAAGPHDKPELQYPMKTPGTGALPPVGSRGTDVGPD